MSNELIGKEIAGKYVIESLIRETELGDFYRGSNRVTGAPVTIKILAPAMAIDARYVERFLDDARAATSVSHQNILNTIEIGSDESGTPFAVFDGIQGSDLTTLLRADRQFLQTRAVSIAKQIASALASAHAAGVVHGGVNPDKIMIADTGNGEAVKLYDFGTRSHSKNSMPAVGFLAPEQCAGLPVSDERSDIYAVGVILYRMLTGEMPFLGTTPAEIIAKQPNDTPLPIYLSRQDLHPEIEPIINSAIAGNPDKRYQAMSDLDEDLGRIAADIGANIPSASAVMAAGAAATPKRNIWQTAFIVLAGVMLLAAALIYATTVRQTNPTVSMVSDADSLPVQPINPATGAQEDALSKLGDLGDASLVPNGSMEIPPGTLPGGDGFNAWANGGVPPAGAPLAGGPLQGSPMTGPIPPQYLPPGGQTVTIDPNGGSQFMPNEGGVILVPVPKTDDPAVKPSPTPKIPASNTAAKPIPTPNAGPAANAAVPNTRSGKPVQPSAKPKKPAI